MRVKWAELRNFKQLERSRQIQIALELILFFIIFSIIINQVIQTIKIAITTIIILAD